METDKLTILTQEVAHIRTWQRTHDKQHNTEGERLNIILETVTDHGSNHHGLKTKARDSGLTVFVVGVIAAIGEIAGLWEFFSRLPFF